MSAVEINFARLLERCDAQSKGPLTGRERFRFENNLQHLRELLDELTTGPHAIADLDKRAAYQKRLDVLEVVLKGTHWPTPRYPSLVARDSSGAVQSAPAAKAAAIAAGDNETAINMKVMHSKAVREQLLPSPAPLADAKNVPISEYEELMSSRRRGRTAQEERPEEVLRQYRQMQDELATSMVASAATLKRNAQEMASYLRRENGVLDSAQSLMDKNIATIRKTNQNVTELTANTPWCTFTMVYAVLAVLLAWCSMYIFIKIF